jgi:hypothetical protein
VGEGNEMNSNLLEKKIKVVGRLGRFVNLVNFRIAETTA